MAQTTLPVKDANGNVVNLSEVQDASNSSALIGVSIPGDPTSGVKGKVTAANELLVAGSGTAGTPSTSVITIQGVGGGTAVPVSVSSATVTQGTAAAITAGWPVIMGESAPVTGTFTNGTQTTSITSATLDGYSTVTISIHGTYGTATAVFEISDDDGTTWYSVNAARSDGGAIETGYTSLTNVSRMWSLTANGADLVRVRSTAVSSGTVNVSITGEAGSTAEATSVTAFLPTGASASQIQGPAADGAAAVGNPVQIGGVDGSGNAQAILTDTSGRQAVIGAAAAGAAVAGNPVMTAVYDGTNTQYTPGTTTGTFVQGNVASNVAITANPLLAGGVGSTATPSAVGADGRAVAVWLSRSGALKVDGQTAVGSAVVGNPVVIGGSDGTNARTITVNTSGSVALLGASSVTDAEATTGKNIDGAGNNRLASVAIMGFSGTTNWERLRTATAGNGIAATGIGISAAYGEYLTNANQPAITTGQYTSLMTDPAGNLRTAPQRPTASDILSGYLQHTSTTAAATVITVPAGRTFVGRVAVSVAASKAAAATGNGLVQALIATAGTNVTPAAGTIFALSTRIGANAATGVVGTQGSNYGSMPITVVAPVGNSVTVTLASTLTSTTEGAVDCSIFGVLQ